MHYLIAGGTGFIGQALTHRWLQAGHEVAILGRSRDKITQLYNAKVTAVEWSELASKGSSFLKEFNAVINLAGASIGESRWTEARKQEIVESRVTPTHRLAELCAQLGAESPPLFNADGVGVYGSQPPLKSGLPEAMDEDTPIVLQIAPDFLAKVGRLWEMATTNAIEAQVRVIKMRFGVVLAQEGGALPQMSLPFKFFLGGPMGSGRQPLSWITLVDLCAAIDFLLTRHDFAGPVNLVAPGCVIQKQFAKALGKALHRPAIVPMPAFVLKFLGQMGEELLLSGQNVYPKRLLELGFRFQYPDIDSALSFIYGRKS